MSRFFSAKLGEEVFDPNRNSLEVRLKQVHKRVVNNKTFRFGEYTPVESNATEDISVENLKNLC